LNAPSDVHGDPLELSPASNADTPVLLAYNPMAQASPSSVHSSGSSSASPPLSAQLKIFEVIETCCKTEDLETLHKLVEEEPLSLRWRDWNGRSPLGFAALLGNVQVSFKSFFHAEQIESQLSTFTSQAGCSWKCYFFQVVEFFMEFLKRQGDVREELNFRLRKGRTALMLACEGGNLLVIKVNSKIRRVMICSY
jgi:ankyrin repeat protein